MRNIRIVADSSANILTRDTIPFAAAPLKIIAADQEFVDDAALDVAQMVADLKAYKGTSGTSCPNAYDWIEAFGDAENVFAVTITSGLSGSYNAACRAAQDYMDENPGRRVCVLDSLSAGPELRLIAEKVREVIDAGKNFEEIQAAMKYDVKFIIGSDAHVPEAVGAYLGSLARAFEAGLEPERIVNIEKI